MGPQSISGAKEQVSLHHSSAGELYQEVHLVHYQSCCRIRCNNQTWNHDKHYGVGLHQSLF